MRRRRRAGAGLGSPEHAKKIDAMIENAIEKCSRFLPPSLQRRLESKCGECHDLADVRARARPSIEPARAARLCFAADAQRFRGGETACAGAATRRTAVVGSVLRQGAALAAGRGRGAGAPAYLDCSSFIARVTHDYRHKRPDRGVRRRRLHRRPSRRGPPAPGPPAYPRRRHQAVRRLVSALPDVENLRLDLQRKESCETALRDAAVGLQPRRRHGRHGVHREQQSACACCRC